MSKQSAAQKLAAQLTSLAKAATPGPWITDGDYVNEHGNVLQSYVANGRKAGGRIASAFANCLVTTDEQCQANAAFIAGANPGAVLALTAEVVRLNAENERLKAQLDVALSGMKAAVDTANWQATTNRELNALVSENRTLKVENERLRARTVIDREKSRMKMRKLLPGVSGDLIDHALFACIDEAMSKEADHANEA